MDGHTSKSSLQTKHIPKIQREKVLDGEPQVKLVIDKESNKVLYGEARKDFVDLIFGLLALPLGAFTKLLTKDAVVGSLGEVYDSLSRIHATDILPYGRRSV
ncbi:hypothetical protein FCM35_KLT18050 [Carex littledalei]|uniref:DUF674 family protein n=1 Tax=Carex littledalei TaxID=544730 RepID=A0A833RKT1_9POAL|nr:hypothetical protein FCM35_KLT18050 [Carex littledalei]